MKRLLVGLAVVLAGILILQFMAQPNDGARVRNTEDGSNQTFPIVGFNGWNDKEWYSESSGITKSEVQLWLKTNVTYETTKETLHFAFSTHDAQTGQVTTTLRGSADLIPFDAQEKMRDGYANQTATYQGSGFIIRISNEPSGVRIQYEGSGSFLDGLLKNNEVILYNATNMLI